MALLEGDRPLARQPVARPAGGPLLPVGRRIKLDGRGTTFVRTVKGPSPDAPTVLLLHGWLASGGLNWFTVFDHLGERYNVVAVDMRGHGRGIRSSRRFQLADCADDAVATLDALGIGKVIPVGYSLGGPVAQLVWRRHPDRVEGLVLAATAHRLMPGLREQWAFAVMMAAAAGSTRLGQIATKLPRQNAKRLMPPVGGRRPTSMQQWVRGEMRRHSSRMVMEAGVAMSNYNARWIRDVDVPTAVLVTTKDRAVAPLVQLQLALAIPGSTIHRVDDGHLLCMKPSFGPVLRAAIDDVVTRAARAA